MNKTSEETHEKPLSNSEAIAELSEMKLDAWTDHKQMEALDMGIKAIKEQEKKHE